MDADAALFTPPRRSGYDLTGGIVYFARMLDKIRLQAEGRLHPAYRENLGGGFDGRCCRYLGIDYPSLCQRTLLGGSNEEVLEWCYGRGIRLSAEQILVWNKFLTKRGWRDEDDGSTQELEAYKTADGLAHRTDIVTYFDYYDVDEGRPH